MAVFIAYEPVDTTGKKFNTSTPKFTTANDVYIVAEYEKHFVEYNGEFEYAGKDLVGNKLNRIDQFNNKNEEQFYWERYKNEYFDPVKVINKAEESGQKYYKYIFQYSDTLYGSPKKDVIAAHKGDDFVFGEKGKDKLYGDKGKDALFGGPGTDKEWGGGGKDIFYFNDGYDKDILKDFERKKDKLVIDTKLAESLNQVEKNAEQNGDDTVIKLKGNTLVIEDYDVDKLKKIKLYFLDEGELL